MKAKWLILPLLLLSLGASAEEQILKKTERVIEKNVKKAKELATKVQQKATKHWDKHSDAYTAGELVLKIGAGVTHNHTNNFDNKKGPFINPTIKSSFTYVTEYWEAGIAAYSAFGRFKKVELVTHDTEVTGDGHYRQTLFAPVAKYIVPHYFKKRWKLFLGIGASFGLHTLRMDSYQVKSGNFKDEYKITYSSTGLLLTAGFEEILPKKLLPTFFEFAYSYSRANTISIVDTTDEFKVETLHEEESQKKIHGHIFMITAGITLF